MRKTPSAGLALYPFVKNLLTLERLEVNDLFKLNLKSFK